ncbi:MAG: hypothetical protein WC956_01740 [bacterium]
MADETKLYKVFNIGEWNVVLPEGSSFNFLSRLTGIGSGGLGNRITDVVDTNENGRPDSGDTAITSWGDRIDNVQLNGDEIKWPEAYDIPATGQWVNETPLKGSGLTYTSKQLESTGGMTFAKSMADSGDHYVNQRQEEARQIAHSISDNPLVTGVIVGAATIASLHPWGRTALEALGIAGSVAGTGYMIYDRLHGAINGSPMAEHDINATLAILGGAGAMRGMQVGEFLSAPIRALKDVLPKVGGGGGMGLFPEYVYATAGGSGRAMAIDGAIASEAGASATTGGTSIDALIPPFVTINALPVISENGRTLAIDPQFFPEVASWDGTEAGRAADDIATFMDLYGNGNKETVLEQIAALKKIYMHAPKGHEGDGVRQLITAGLKDIYAMTDEAARGTGAQSTDLVADTASRQISSNLEAIVKAAKGVGRFEGGEYVELLTVMRESAAPADLNLPSNVTAYGRVSSQVGKNGLVARLQWASEQMNTSTAWKNTRIKDLGKDYPGLFEVRDFDGPGYRTYFTRDGDKFVIFLCEEKGRPNEQEMRIKTAYRLLLEWKNSRQVH